MNHFDASDMAIISGGSSQAAEIMENVPEILAPAGGRAQFFAALQAGADAVYLGLKEFNARGRAENFTIEDLQELVPIARQLKMKVLVTLNIILKEAELPRLIDDLAALQWIGIEAVIVQDLGVARVVREYFPNIKIHASTQLAVHNLDGVLAAAELGFRRVVLARELTAQELRLIRKAVSRDVIEIEAFCHGSLCYSYSGLCFFSGAEDARSGNRGECAYTCRKPYRILNEPGHGFLFSMKDLDTSRDLAKLVKAGVDTLKIEGRKKDAQYVATTVGLYRAELNKIFGRDTSPECRSIDRDFRKDMAFSYHRDTTSFFVNGRYHENVIDLANPTHKGQMIGRIEKLVGYRIELTTTEILERFDGLRIDRDTSWYHAKPQHGDTVKASLNEAQKRYDNEICQFSLRNLSVDGRAVPACKSGQKVSIELPKGTPLPKVGDLVYKTRSNELKRFTDGLSQAPKDLKLRPLRLIEMNVDLETHNGDLIVKATANLATHELVREQIILPAERPRRPATLLEDLNQLLGLFGDLGLETKLTIQGDHNWFVPRQQLKEFKKQLANALEVAIPAVTEKTRKTVLQGIQSHRNKLNPTQNAQYQIKFDRLSTLDAIMAFQRQNPEFKIDELIFEPKRAFLGQVAAKEIWQQIENFASELGAKVRLALPTVIRAWDEALLKPWVQSFVSAGENRFEIGNIGALVFLEKCGLNRHELDLASDFSLYALNTEAIKALATLNMKRISLSIEDDEQSLRDKCEHWPENGPVPQVILYKDTPLFIAEACSLTALHHGCPTAQVCGYRTLEIENDAGDRFFVAHESCKSIVYGAEAFSLSQYRRRLQSYGVQDFRIDFLTRPYDQEAISGVLQHVFHGKVMKACHSANFERELL